MRITFQVKYMHNHVLSVRCILSIPVNARHQPLSMFAKVSSMELSLIEIPQSIYTVASMPVRIPSSVQPIWECDNIEGSTVINNTSYLICNIIRETLPHHLHVGLDVHVHADWPL